jgi:nucleoside-diphosphate-sugar epimerase
MWDSDDQKKQSIQYAENFSSAIRANGVKNAVFLSSYGAHRLDDAGAISGMGLAEVVLNKLDGVNVLSLRAGYFYSNLLLPLDLVKTAGHMGNMFAIPDGTFTMVDPDDIARVTAEALDKLNFKGHSHVYVISDLSGTDEIASLIGIPDLKWVKFPAEDFKKMLLNYGFADGAANAYVKMFATLDTGLLFEDIQKTRPKVEGTSIEAFAKAWAAAYR